ncbi:failed axon connections homolog isoform X2 [Nematostella vectensis]|uniref:failed axon connections homolog isoform X2 n=1 Tax=Nematostella vectensis TaxID=45351 RepID=UPI00139047F1|nr:failed axon connections homolog isoform X2 [Nematostella vectensis]
MAEKTTKNALVTLYVMAPTSRSINPSPFCLKLETFLRMTKIPYKTVYGWNPSSKGKLPWIEYQGKSIADSNFCVDFLNKEFFVDVDEHLTVEQKAVARAVMVTLEENTYWTLMHYVWCTDHANVVRDEAFSHLPSPIRHVVFWRVQSACQGYLQAHGMGRHTEEEIYAIAERDLKGISALLGDQKYMFGERFVFHHCPREHYPLDCNLCSEPR